ncbi:MAG: hypothetical protein C0471_03435 [Erythrobacter sp.]|nr:hypothetical protein [Erythrobacter sp.]
MSLIKRLAYHLAWFALVVILVYNALIQMIASGLSEPVRIVLIGILVAVLAALRELADMALRMGRYR